MATFDALKLAELEEAVEDLSDAIAADTGVNPSLLKKNIETLETSFNAFRRSYNDWKAQIGTEEYEESSYGQVWMKSWRKRKQEMLNSAYNLVDKLSKPSTEDLAAEQRKQEVELVAFTTKTKKEVQQSLEVVRIKLSRLQDKIKDEVVSIAGLSPIVVEMKGLLNESESKMREMESRASGEYAAVKESFETTWKELQEDISALEIALADRVPTPTLAALGAGVSQASGSAGATGATGGRSHTQMTKQKPPAFDGDILKYPDWKKTWEATVHASKPEEYNEVWMLIENIPESYRPYVETCTELTEVWGELDKLFGNPKRQYRAMLTHIRSLDVGKCPEYDRTIKISIEVQNLINRVDGLGMKVVLENTPDIIPSLYSKLPVKVQREWTKEAVSSGGGDWDEFVAFLKTQRNIAVAERDLALSLSAVQVGDTGKPSKSGGKGGLTCHICEKPGHFARECPDKRSKGAPRVSVNTAKATLDVCKYCNEETHFYKPGKGEEKPTTRLYNCKRFQELGTAAERGVAIEKIGGCVICTATDHNRDSGKCPLKKRKPDFSCDQIGCSGAHARLFHGAPNAYCNSVQTSVNSAVVKGKCEVDEIKREMPGVDLDAEVLLAAQNVLVGGHTALTFWDDGATRSFITSQYAKKVGLVGRPITFIVETMGGKLAEERGMLYEIDLTSTDGVRHTIWAFGVEQITTMPRVDL